MSEQLTRLESSVYQYLLDFTAEHTYQPSIRDIGKQFEIKSTKTVSDLLQSLARKGYIERDPSRSRGVRLLGFSGTAQSTPVPYYGKIHAGEPALLPEHREGFITMDRRFLPSDRVFFLKVKGDSMIGRAIESGDFVMVDPVTAPQGRRHDSGSTWRRRDGQDARRMMARRSYSKPRILRTETSWSAHATTSACLAWSAVCSVPSA